MKFTSLLLLLSILCLSCKKDIDKPYQVKEIQNASTSKLVTLDSKINSAYNLQKFVSEAYLKYSVNFNISDSTYFKGILKYNINTQSLLVKNTSDEFSMSSNSQKNNLQKSLWDLNEIYILPFSLNPEALKESVHRDTIVESSYSLDPKSVYTIYSHPQTHIIQSVQVDKDDSVFDNFNIQFRKFITVNRIPVSLDWRLFKDNIQIGSIHISRISFPKK